MADVFRYTISPQYCQTMGIPLRSGRLLDERDNASAPQSALISESLARSQFPHQDAIGKRVKVGPPDRPWYTIVGVVGDIKQSRSQPAILPPSISPRARHGSPMRRSRS